LGDDIKKLKISLYPPTAAASAEASEAATTTPQQHHNTQQHHNNTTTTPQQQHFPSVIRSLSFFSFSIVTASRKDPPNSSLINRLSHSRKKARKGDFPVNPSDQSVIIIIAVFRSQNKTRDPKQQSEKKKKQKRNNFF